MIHFVDDQSVPRSDTLTLNSLSWIIEINYSRKRMWQGMVLVDVDWIVVVYWSCLV